MFFYFSKLLSFIISPLVWIIILFIWSYKTTVETKAKKIRMVALALLYVCCNSFIVDECFRFWETTTPDFNLKTEKYDGAIILGGIGDIDLRLQQINFSASADRLFQIIPLFYSKNVKKIIFSGGSSSIEFSEKKEGIYVKKYLKSIQIPDSSILCETASKNTYENAVFTKKLIDSLHIKGNFLLVTSACHMKRALMVFKKAGFKNVTPFTTNRVSGSRRFTPDHLFIPSPIALSNLHLIIHEWVGYLIYKLKGYA